MLWETSDWSLVTSGLFTIHHATVEIIGGLFFARPFIFTNCLSIELYTAPNLMHGENHWRKKKLEEREIYCIRVSYKRTRIGGGEGVAAICFYRYIFTLTTVTKRNMANKHLHFQTMIALCRVNSALWELSSAPYRLQLWNSETGKYMKKNMILFNKRETGEYLKKYNTNYAVTATTCRDHFDYWPTNENYQKSKLIKHEIIRTQILSSVEKCEVLKRY